RRPRRLRDGLLAGFPWAPVRYRPALPAAARRQIPAAHPHPALRRHHSQVPGRLHRSLRRSQTCAPWGSAATEPYRPGRRARTARPPLPAPERHRRHLISRAPQRPGNLRIPAGPQVIPMRLGLLYPPSSAPSAPPHGDRVNPPPPSLVLAFLCVFLPFSLRVSAAPRQSPSPPATALRPIAPSAALA